MHVDTSKRAAGTARFRALGFLARFLLYAALSAAATVHWETIASQARSLASWPGGGSQSKSPSDLPLRGIWKGSAQPTGSVQSAQSEASVRSHGSSVLAGNGSTTGVLPSLAEQGVLSGGISLGTVLDDASLFQLVADRERARLQAENGTIRGQWVGGQQEGAERGNGEMTGRRKGKDKIAFLFVTPSSLPLSKLWCQFFFGHDSLYSIYVQSDSSDPDVLQDLASCFLGSVIPLKDASPSDSPMAAIDAHRRLLAHALLDPSNSRFVLLTDKCIPTFNFFFAYNYLMGTPLSYVRAVSLEGPQGNGRWHEGFMPLVRREQWRKGTRWVTLDRELALAVVQDRVFYDLFATQCKWNPHRCCCGEEHYIPTMLSILYSSKIANRSLTWTEWAPHAGSWMSFSKEDARPQLVDLLRGAQECSWDGSDKAYCFLFARELEPDALELLLRLGSAMGY